MFLNRKLFGQLTKEEFVDYGFEFPFSEKCQTGTDVGDVSKDDNPENYIERCGPLAYSVIHLQHHPNIYQGNNIGKPIKRKHKFHQTEQKRQKRIKLNVKASRSSELSFNKKLEQLRENEEDDDFQIQRFTNSLNIETFHLQSKQDQMKSPECRKIIQKIDYLDCSGLEFTDVEKYSKKLKPFSQSSAEEFLRWIEDCSKVIGNTKSKKWRLILNLLFYAYTKNAVLEFIPSYLPLLIYRCMKCAIENGNHVLILELVMSYIFEFDFHLEELFKGKKINSIVMDTILQTAKGMLLRENQALKHNAVSLSFCHECSKERQLVIMLLHKGNIKMKKALPEKLMGIKLVLYNYTEPSEEASLVTNSGRANSSGENLPVITEEDARKLFKKHSNLMLISAPPIKSTGFSQGKLKLVKSPCVRLLCWHKGFIPLGESEFPNSIYEFEVDVQEGFCFLAGGGSRNAGEQIRRVGGSFYGSIGGFVDLPNDPNDSNTNAIGFITSGHCLLTSDESKMPREELKDEFQKSKNSEVEVFDRHLQTFHVCGNIVDKCVSERCSADNNTVDAALIKLGPAVREIGFPVVPLNQLHSIGFDRSTLPTFNGEVVNVEVLNTSRIFERLNIVIKYGCSTGLTRGILNFQGAHVRFVDMEFSRIHGDTFKVYKQLEVRGLYALTFSGPGDSGAFVFCINPDNTLSCVGMVIGYTSSNSCIVTPIVRILDSFGLPHELKPLHSFPYGDSEDSSGQPSSSQLAEQFTSGPSSNYDKVNTNDLMEFLKREKITISHARGILVGCAEAGKTTLLKRLRGQNDNPEEGTKSTRGLKVHQHIFIVKDGILEVTDDDSPLTKFIRIHVADIIKTDPSSAVDISDSKESCDERTEVLLYSREEKNENFKEIDSAPNENENKENTDELGTNNLASEDKAMENEEFLQKLLSDKENLPTVSMLDFAGQLAYYACHQIYITPKVFFVLVLDMTRKFNEVVNKEQINQDGSIFSIWTYKDYLKFWITSIKTFGETKAPVFLIATHTETKSSAEIEKYFEEFWEAVPFEDKDWLYDSIAGREFRVGLIELNAKTKETLGSIKNSIVEILKNTVNMKIEMPSSWALMEQLLYEGDWKVLSLDEIWQLNLTLSPEYQIKDDEEMCKFLRCFHDNGFLLHFEDEKLKEHAILDIQWFANAFSRIIADENHINRDCKKRLISEWKSFNKTGVLKDKVIDALWQEEPLYLKHKDKIMGYMEKLQMLVPLESLDADVKSWYVPCMNKKQFKVDFSEEKWECSSILCFRFTSFAMFIYYRLVAYCISFFKWSVSIDCDNEESLCLYQTAAVFDHKDHTVVVGICRDDIQLQVLRIRPLVVDKESSNEIGDAIEKAIEILTNTFIDTKIFHKGFKCLSSICNEKDRSFTPESYLSTSKTHFMQCRCRIDEKHVINVQRTLGFWSKIKIDISNTSGHGLEGRSRFAKIGMASIDVLNQACRDVLESEVNPSDIEKVSSYIMDRLSKDQKSALKDAKVSGYKNFDMTLIYTLIRNVCSKIPKPTKTTWGGVIMPPEGHNTVGDDVERCRMLRNNLFAHVSSASTDQTKFDETWMLMKNICQRLGLFTKKNYIDELHNIQKLTLKEENEDEIIEYLKSENPHELLMKLMADMQEIKAILKPQSKADNHK